MDENNYKYNPETGEPIVKETVNEQPSAEAPKYQEAEQPQYQAPNYQAQQQAYQAPNYQAQQPHYQAPNYQAQQQAYQAPQYQPPQHQYNAAASNPSNGKGIAGLVLSICSIVFCWIGIYFCFPGLIPLAMSIVGIIIPKNIAPYDKPAKICGIIGLVLSILFMIIGIVVIAGFSELGRYGYNSWLYY